jgi:hypothetical protein
VITRKGNVMKKLLIVFTVIVGLGLISEVKAGTYVVPGTSDPWLAGMPNGSQDNIPTPEPPDVAPAQSPVGPIDVLPGQVLTWTASGQVGHPMDIADPDGKPWEFIWTRYIGANNNMSDIQAPIDSLLGVFLGPTQPDLNPPPPSALDFSTTASREYVSLTPEVQQVFFMGDGLGAGGAQQQIVVPAGATRFYLGIMDGYGWANNIGAFEVTINGAPDGGSTLMLLGVVFGAMAAMRRRLGA